MAGIADEAPLRLRPDVVATVLDDGALLLDLEEQVLLPPEPERVGDRPALRGRHLGPRSARTTCARAGAPDGQVEEITSYLVV